VRRLQAGAGPAPALALVLGSGFAGVRDAVTVEWSAPFARLPGFVAPEVPGHAGAVLVGRLAGVRVCVLAGRAHYYEGHDLATVTYPVRVLARWGVRLLVLTNAAGGIHPRLRPGDFLALRAHLHAAARETGVRLRAGVYLAVSGPSYETPAEIRAFARLGADAVGMSTVPEAIVARQCGLRVAGLSCITNRAAGLSDRPITHAEVLTVAGQIRERATRLLGAFVRRVGGA